MITLGGITISDNMYLSGLESVPLVAVQQVRSVEGNSLLRAKPIVGGKNLTLGSQNSGGIQGLWCQSDINDIKDLEAAALPVALNYRGDAYTVIISGTSFTPFRQFELEGNYKKFTGIILLIEVA